MAISSNSEPRSRKGLAGDARDLALRLGSPEDLDALGSALATPASAAVTDFVSLRRFLTSYVSSVLIPVELPAVSRGFALATRGAVAELIAFDQAHLPSGLAASLAEASQHVGRSHLRRMQPLRGERRVQRYWRAVQRREARAWHTIVYGLVLAVYALPLRQGLVNFGCQTVRGFIRSARTRLDLDDAECLLLEQELQALLTPAIEAMLEGSNGPRLLAL
jgi:urease accessory protein UreF